MSTGDEYDCFCAHVYIHPTLQLYCPLFTMPPHCRLNVYTHRELYITYSGWFSVYASSSFSFSPAPTCASCRTQLTHTHFGRKNTPTRRDVKHTLYPRTHIIYSHARNMRISFALKYIHIYAHAIYIWGVVCVPERGFINFTFSIFSIVTHRPGGRGACVTYDQSQSKREFQYVREMVIGEWVQLGTAHGWL